MTFTKWRQSAMPTWWQAESPTETDRRLVSFLLKDPQISSLRKLLNDSISRVITCARNYRNLSALSS